jgi:hypothetical protein
MEHLHSIQLGNYRNIYRQLILINLLMIAAAFLLVHLGVRILPTYSRWSSYALPVLALMVILSFFHTSRHRAGLRKLQSLDDYDARIRLHGKIYRYRLLWFFFSCLCSCALYVLSGQSLFFYFSLIDTFTLLPYYPDKTTFRKEIGKEDLVFIE